MIARVSMPRHQIGMLLTTAALGLSASAFAQQPDGGIVRQDDPPGDAPAGAAPAEDDPRSDLTPQDQETQQDVGIGTRPGQTSEEVVTEQAPQQEAPLHDEAHDHAHDHRDSPMAPIELDAADYHLDEYDFDPDELCPFCEITPQWPKGRRGLHWHSHWKAVGWPEYVSTPLLFALAFSIEPLSGEVTEARWSRPILFDDTARDALAAESEDGQNRTKLASDVLFYASVAYPVVIDNILVTWIGRQSPRVAWQLFVINAQSYALATALNTATKRISARERPWGERCPNAITQNCDGPERYRSFYSGHATITATGAGLTCAHHTQLSLYKNPALDSTACLAAVGFTAATGVLRMSSDNHWASDVLIGHLMGYLVGYLFPTLMYYREFRFTPEEPHRHERPKAPPTRIWAVVPIVQPGSAQLSAMGLF